ncbi:hypothetical protein ACWGXJ_25350 [Paenibacillus sp. S33]
MTKPLGITEKYSREIQEIGNKLRDLENGRIYEKTGAQMDGYLTTNIQQLRKMFTELISKIDNQDPSMNEKLAEALGRIERP